MLKVPSVDAAVADLTSKGGRVVYESLTKTKKKTTTQNADETEKYRNAFVELGYVGSGRTSKRNDDDDEGDVADNTHNDVITVEPG